MSGPGWLPSRPRPLGLAKRRLVSYLPRRSRKARCAPDASDARAAEPTYSDHGVLNRRGRLPVARLVVPGRSGATLQGWLMQRWLWTRPRMIPLMFAFLGCVGMLNARRYLLELARGPAMVCQPADAANMVRATRLMLVAPHTPEAHIAHPERCVVDRFGQL